MWADQTCSRTHSSRQSNGGFLQCVGGWFPVVDDALQASLMCSLSCCASLSQLLLASSVLHCCPSLNVGQGLLLPSMQKVLVGALHTNVLTKANVGCHSVSEFVQVSDSSLKN